MQQKSYSLYSPIIMVWVLLAGAILTLVYCYPSAHWGYRYYGMAYAMWVKQSFWYPTWHDAINVQKPPLFYWLTNLAWKVFGIQLLVMPGIILICYLLTAVYTAKSYLVLHNDKTSAQLAAILVLINITLLQYATFIRFDIQLSLSFILAFYALCKILRERKFSYWGLYVLANIMGLLFKGLVIFLFSLPAACLGLLILHATKATKVRYLGQVLLFSLLAIAITLIWFIPANLHSHGLYGHTILTQTIQRFSHTHPDPNIPSLVIKNYHWWNTFGYFFIYLAAALVIPFILNLPLLALRLYYGYKQQSTTPDQKQIVLFLSLLVLTPCVIFSSCVGQVQYRYILPLIPIACLLLAYLSAGSLSNIQTRLETRISRIYLGLLALLAVIIVALAVWLPSLNSNAVLLLQIALGLLLIAMLSWNALNFRQRQQRFCVGMILFAYIFLLGNLIALRPYPTIATTAQQLQYLQQKNIPIYEVNDDETQVGWTQFLARNVDVPYLSPTQFEAIKNYRRNQAWIIYRTSLLTLQNKEDQVYPLQYTTQWHHPVPVLMPYSIYQQVKQ